jgi:3',5'-cyclic AMP phosphodiesterase CpdA
MLDTNVYKTNIKYGAPASYGQIGQETYQWIRECAKLAKESNAQMIAVMHHNLLKHSPVLSYGFTLDNYEEALEVLEECDVKLALSGHIHIQDIKRSRNEEHPIYDVVTSSLCTYPQQYGVLEFDPEQGYDYHTTRVDVASWAKSKNLQNEYLLNFSTNSEKFFADRAYKRIYNQLTETGIYTEYEIELMSDTVSRLNVNYFAGTVPSVREEILESEGYKLWRKATEPERMVTYVNSLVFDYKIDNTKLHISN